jgi:tRNA(His) 5'-end guanylyltransferase
MWQRRGVLVYKDDYEVAGFDPVRKEIRSSTRKKVVQDWEVPQFSSEEGNDLLKKHLIGY